MYSTTPSSIVFWTKRPLWAAACGITPSLVVDRDDVTAVIQKGNKARALLEHRKSLRQFRRQVREATPRAPVELVEQPSSEILPGLGRVPVEHTPGDGAVTCDCRR